jgi:hypothetical protein
MSLVVRSPRADDGGPRLEEIAIGFYEKMGRMRERATRPNGCGTSA